VDALAAGGDSSSSLFYFVLLLLSLSVPSVSLFLLLFLTLEVLLSTTGRNGGNWRWCWWLLCGKQTVVLSPFLYVSSFPPLCLPLLFSSFFASVSLFFPLCFPLSSFFVFFVLSNRPVHPSKIFSPPPLVRSPPLLFISRRRGSPLLCPIMVQGGAGLPYLCRLRWLPVCRAWCPSHLFNKLARYVGEWAVLGREGGAAWEKMSSKTLLPLLHVKRRKKQPNVVQNSTV